MVLVILITNVLIIKKEMMKVPKKEDKLIKEKEPQRKFSRKTYAPKKTYHHQLKMNSVTVRQKGFYSWKYNTLIKKTMK